MRKSIGLKGTLPNYRTVISNADSAIPHLDDLDAEDEFHDNNDDGEFVRGFREDIVLLPHQVVARSWMRERETGNNFGGILADEMGLGKTIEALARIVDGRPTKADITAGWSNATLIVCPVNVISQWVSEIHKVTSGSRVIEHHGPKRPTDPSHLAEADFVITSYPTLTSENGTFQLNGGKIKSGKQALLRVKWFRLVLDEAQTIKNWKTKCAEACWSLQAKYRWCLTGTPMQNSLNDFYSLYKFLKISPLDDWGTFKVKISGASREVALKTVHDVNDAIMLRREKADTLHGEATLPERTVKIVSCKFNAAELSFYAALENKTVKQVKRIQYDEARARGAYMHILVYLLRLRQACDHPSLVYEDYNTDREAIGLGGIEWKQSTTDASLTATHECQICETALPAGSTAFYCEYCADITDQTSTRTRSASLPDSAKIRMISRILRIVDKRGGNEKTVIFSQFTSMLNLIEPFLQTQRRKYVRYDGSMTRAQRDASLKELQNSAATRVILISFKAGGLGLNLTSCNNVILVDPWWNPALEEQAFDRVHRLGQTRNVHIYKLTIKDTIEDRIQLLQDKKRELTKAALNNDKAISKSAKLGMNELLALFKRDI